MWESCGRKQLYLISRCKPIFSWKIKESHENPRTNFPTSVIDNLTRDLENAMQQY
jgi:hypothetical protein